jgi:hypothetical protein
VSDRLLTAAEVADWPAVPGMFVQAKAGHARGSTTERYLHAQQTSYPDAAEFAEERLFAGLD